MLCVLFFGCGAVHCDHLPAKLMVLHHQGINLLRTTERHKSDATGTASGMVYRHVAVGDDTELVEMPLQFLCVKVMLKPGASDSLRIAPLHMLRTVTGAYYWVHRHLQGRGLYAWNGVLCMCNGLPHQVLVLRKNGHMHSEMCPGSGIASEVGVGVVETRCQDVWSCPQGMEWRLLVRRRVLVHGESAVESSLAAVK